MPTSSSPPDAADGVFFVSASILIDAARDKIWSTILDFPSYREWLSAPLLVFSAFDEPPSRGQTIIDESGHPLPDQTPAEGQSILISPVHLPPTMGKPGWFQQQSSFAKILTVDHENYRVSWIATGMPEFLLRAERWQMLSVESDGKTKYESIEVFGGILAYVVKYLFQEKLVLGVKAQAEGLKVRAERM